MPEVSPEKGGKPASDKPVEEKDGPVKLPRAEYNDFMTIRNDWGKIAAAQTGFYEAVFKNTSVEPAGDGCMCIVFPNDSVSRFGSSEEALLSVTDYVKKNYQKEIVFQTRVRKNANEPSKSYILSDEDLKEAIHFPVEKVKNKEDI